MKTLMDIMRMMKTMNSITYLSIFVTMGILLVYGLNLIATIIERFEPDFALLSMIVIGYIMNTFVKISLKDDVETKEIVGDND